MARILDAVSPVRRLGGYLFRYRWRYAAGVACLAAATALALGIPWTVKQAVDGLSRGQGGRVLAQHVGVILLLAAGHGMFRLASRLAMVGAGQGTEHDVRRDLYLHFEQLPPAFYHRHRTGDLMSRATSDVAAVRMLAGFGSVMLVGTVLTFGGSLVAMWLIDPQLTLATIAPFPLLIFLAKRFNHAVDRQSTAVQEQQGVLAAKVQENLAGMAVVRAYTMERAEIARFGQINREFLVRSARLARTQAGFTPLIGLITGIGTLIILWLGGRAVVEERITLGALVAFNGYLAHLAWPTIALGWMLASLRRGLAAMARIAEVLEAPPLAPAEAGSCGVPPAAPAGAAVEVRGLTFAHEAREPALRDVDVLIPAGSLVAVVGPTGGGKSTLGALIVRLFEPPRGSVFVDGVDVRAMPLRELRHLVAYVPQEPFLFSRSLRDNLGLAADAVGDGEVARAVAAAGLDRDVADLPQGLGTVLGERGITLSGGQRSRAALARALVADPRVLVLDDPFAAVDPDTECEILTRLQAARAGRTTVIITHRLRAAARADWVVTLAGGRVVEQGRHADLVGRGGLYARLWRLQQIEDELERSEP
ncbi:MAG TPA: ABC transporter ATP-binding protein [Candidatus Binatia bacterium]|nr:ABC transporter ATP-binding protein [Candidatus Binatia bacterium]